MNVFTSSAARHATRHTSHVTCRTSHVARRTSHFTRLLCRVTSTSERAHVIVDLNTWTDGHVISSIASAHLLAPVVVSAIGHPGTSGSYSHTHVLVDAVSAPVDLFTSRLGLLPLDIMLI
jgi:predicted O-linked N-acetylglucosamine transferase (SPINDLY family)